MATRSPRPPADRQLLLVVAIVLACGDDGSSAEESSSGTSLPTTGTTGEPTSADSTDTGNAEAGTSTASTTMGTSTGSPTSSAGDDSTDDGGSDGGSSTGELIDPPPFTPLHRIDVRVHVGSSDLTMDELEAVLEEMNFIWRSQAGVCFEFEVVDHEEIRQGGFDMWFIRNSDPRVSSFNGVYRGDHDILTRNSPGLGGVENPAMFAPARTAAHELGHGLTLGHTNDPSQWGADHRENLMASGTFGWHIPLEPEDPRDQVLQSRERAAQKALPDAGELDCGPPTFE